ncbi:MAG: pilus assembly protein TadG-related protein, partial [Phascolarctobacterium sp.]
MLKTLMQEKLNRAQRGAVMVLFALLLPVLCGFMGLSIDVGMAYVEKGKVQDIADSAALAGAAQLAEEGDRLAAIQAAVKEYVEANGIALGENGMLLKATNESWDDKETLAVGQDALVAYGVVTFADGETPDRVRVRITKRIPSFFVNVLGDFSDGFTVVAKAAAEGEGEEIETIVGGPGLIAFGDLNFDTDQIFSRKGMHSKGYGNDIYFGGNFNIDKPNGKDGKFMLEGDYYATHE